MRLLRLEPSAALKEKRLQALLEGRSADNVPGLLETLADAWVLGCLQLAGRDFAWEEVRAARDRPGVPEIVGLQRALTAWPTARPFALEALRTWHSLAIPGGGTWRTQPRPAGGGAAAPFIVQRIEALAGWLAQDSARELRPAAAGALVLARVVEIAPFAEGNGRVARLAAAHTMARAGARLPVLVKADGPRLEQALQAAFALDTEPLVTLLEEASGRALEVLIQTLEGQG